MHLAELPPLYLNSHGTHIHILPIMQGRATPEREEGINKIELLRLFSALNGHPTAYASHLYRVTRHLDSYILLTSVFEVPLACLGSS